MSRLCVKGGRPRPPDCELVALVEESVHTYRDGRCSSSEAVEKHGLFAGGDPLGENSSSLGTNGLSVVRLRGTRIPKFRAERAWSFGVQGGRDCPQDGYPELGVFLPGATRRKCPTEDRSKLKYRCGACKDAQTSSREGLTCCTQGLCGSAEDHSQDRRLGAQPRAGPARRVNRKKRDTQKVWYRIKIRYQINTAPKLQLDKGVAITRVGGYDRQIWQNQKKCTIAQHFAATSKPKPRFPDHISTCVFATGTAAQHRGMR